tara:strand:- start:5008 stop:6399 length:1392 start_codon:yes stop_codon:yes gene_type:complete
MHDLNLRLKRLDAEIGLLLKEADELDFWYYLRVRVAMQNWGEVSEKISIINVRKLRMIIKLFYLSIGNLFRFRRNRAKKHSVKLYSTSTSCFFSEDNENNFIDAFSPCGEKNENSIYLIHAGNLSNINLLNWLYKRNDVIFDNILVKYLSFLLSKINYRIDKLTFRSKGIDAKSEEISSLLKSNGFSLTSVAINLSFRRFMIEKKLYQILLKSLKINSGDESFVVSAYTKVSLVWALKSLKLDVTEYQHGISGVNHYGYDVDENIFGGKFRNRVIPDKFLAYNKYWQGLMKQCGHYKNGVEIHPYKKLVRAKKNGVLPSFLLGQSFVLFTGGFNDDELSIQFCKNAHLKLEKLELDVMLIFRPHPKDSIERYEKLFENYQNILVYSDFSVLTETLLCHCLAHVSVYSACHFDAIDVIGRTYVFHSETDKSELEEHIVNRPDLFIRTHNGTSFVEKLVSTLDVT